MKTQVTTESDALLSTIGYARAKAVDSPLPIFVDLDGTLIRSDMLLESMVAAIRRNFFLLFMLPLWLLRGRPFLKAKLASCSSIDPAVLPYNEELVEYLKAKKQSGHRLYLATASNIQLARKVADHLDIFDGVMASDGATNLKGSRKLSAIQLRLLGKPFLYAGNSSDDLAIWKHAAGAVTVDIPGHIRRSLYKTGIPIEASFSKRVPLLKTLFKALRIYQWSKNVLVFVPMMLAHSLELNRLIPAVIGFFALSLCASAFYVVNDLLDVEADRAHPRKRRRPFASGDLGIQHGLAILAILVPVIVGLASLLPPTAGLLLALYATANFSYSVWLKRELFIDVLVLSCMYTLRILFGGEATGIKVSIWTLAFSIFLFLGLALVKRLTELRTARQTGTAPSRRAYVELDIDSIRSFAGAALYLSVLVLALYINTPDVRKLYGHAEALWFVCLALIYWVSRVLMMANRGAMTDDPIVFAFKDRASYVTGLLLMICVFFAL